MKLKRNIALMFVCIILGVTLTWQFQSISNNKKAVLMENKREDELKSDLFQKISENEKLRTRNYELQADVDKYKASIGSYDGTTKALQEELDKVRMMAGLTDVKGKGITITLSKGDNANFTVQDQDILKVLNELRASDAQAISINGERILALSEVRRAGKYIMINGKSTADPFEIRAIGDPAKMENALKMTGGVYETFVEFFHLKMTIKQSDSITIPKVRDDGTVIRTDLLTAVTTK